MQKPDWWPTNPYPESIFPMPEERYAELFPDPQLRTALSGMLGRQFWDIASEAIWKAMLKEDAEALERVRNEMPVKDYVWCQVCGKSVVQTTKHTFENGGEELWVWVCKDCIEPQSHQNCRGS